METKYLSGFGNHFETQCQAGVLPEAQNSPQKHKLGLFAEQISGTAFTAPRVQNQKTWVYRKLPSVTHSDFRLVDKKSAWSSFHSQEAEPVSPAQQRWDAIDYPQTSTDFIDGIFTYAQSVGAGLGTGVGALGYACNKNMEGYFYNSDGDLLILPQEGDLELRTEMGILKIAPKEIAVIPRGIKFQVHLISKQARGYICENFGASFRLPDLGPIGANGLANPHDFLAPVAWFEDKKGPFELVTKFQGRLWKTQMQYSPLDVMGWRGNLYPYKYDLNKFNTINTVSFDHPDPSIFTVLTSPSSEVGVANCDFVIFPPRWMVAEHTFRPPYYHRNCMSEFMGLIHGIYDAKEKGFEPGGASLHNCFSAHGPDKDTFERATESELKPVKQDKTLAFMFESKYVFAPSSWALKSKHLQKDYLQCWNSLNELRS